MAKLTKIINLVAAILSFAYIVTVFAWFLDEVSDFNLRTKLREFRNKRKENACCYTEQTEYLEDEPISDDEKNTEDSTYF